MFLFARMYLRFKRNKSDMYSHHDFVYSKAHFEYLQSMLKAGYSKRALLNITFNFEFVKLTYKVSLLKRMYENKYYVK